MATIKAAYRYIDEGSRAKFCDSQCLLTISVGQEVHENEKLETTIDLINNSFRSCILMIDDSLQRHTMVLDRAESAEDMYPIAIDEGDRWLMRNQKYFNNLSNLTKIIRWDIWLNHPQFRSNQMMIIDTIKNDSAFKEIIDKTIHEFLQRYYGRLLNGTHFNLRKGYKLCFDYLVEECSAMTLWPELDCQFEVYPSKRNFAMDETHKRFVLPQWPELLHAVAVKFKNRKQLKPQVFEFLTERNHRLEERLLVG
ncbi:MAG: hypothetical protein H0U73_04470 [Tatlockia sp.]|nr:hypothetical protein [Tatlockia sp.]